MKNFIIFFVIGLILFCPDKVERLAAQEQRSERRDRNRERSDRPERGDRPPWMQGGENARPPMPMSGGGNDRPPWMGGGVPGGERSGGQSDAERNERSLGMLRSMDTNRNGKLEQNEIPEYRRGFVSMIVTRLGGDPNKTIDLAELTRKTATSARSPQTSASPSGSSGSATPLATDPLVPYFGEKEEAKTAVLAFGQRESQAKTVVAGTTNSTVPVSQSDRILRSAREIMNKYDKNKNGTLDKDKSEWISSLPFKADAADKNRDGRISMTELLDTLGGKANVTTGAAAVSTKQSAAYDRLPAGMPDWFFERDKDQDGQLSMIEYANGQSWSEMIADEFRFLDKNNDGVATVSEIIETLKQVDEEKRLKEEQAKRDAERRKGVAATTSALPAAPPQPEGQPAPSSQPSPNPPAISPPSGIPAEGNAPPNVPPPPNAPPSNIPPSPNAPPPNVPPPPNTSSSSPPSESSPSWRPSGSVPATTPSTAPYSSGTTGSSDSERRRSYQRSGSSRSRGR
jgi:Ca2+-binding EF-hand superfamily protein